MPGGLKKQVDETYKLSKKKGGGVPRFEVWVDASGKVVRYNLAYVNQDLFQGDNGRVLGYDNAHARHHRHYFGRESAVDCRTFEEVERRFLSEWQALMKEVRHGKG